METIDVESMASPLEGESSGANQEYNSLYLEMESLATGVPESVMGEEVVAGKDPDWSKLYKNCMELWKTTRDLRVAVYLTFSLSQVGGLKGFRDGLKLVDFLVTDLWDSFYPQLDEDDDNDPTERLNILQIISPSLTSGNDPLTFLAPFRQVKLFDKRKYSLRDLLVYLGEITTDEPFESVTFDGEMLSQPTEAIEEMVAVVTDILSILDKIESTVNEKIGSSFSFSFECLKKEITTLSKFYNKLLSSDGTVVPEVVVGGASAESQGGMSSGGSSNVNIDTYRPKSRKEALQLVKKSAEYFQQVEPTNPVPYLLERVLRIAEMNFVDILRDIDPNAVDRVKEQLGIPRD